MSLWTLAIAAVNIGAQYLSETPPNVGNLSQLQMVRQLAVLNETIQDTNKTLSKLIEAVQDQDEETALGKVISSTFETQQELERLLLQISESRTFEDTERHLESLKALYGLSSDRIQNSLLNNIHEQISILKQYPDKEFILVTLSFPILQTIVSLLSIADFLFYPDQLFKLSENIEIPTSHPNKIIPRPLGDHLGDLKYVYKQIETIIGDADSSLFEIFEVQFHNQLEKFRDTRFYEGQDVVKYSFQFPDREVWRKYREGENFTRSDLDGIWANKVEVTTSAPLVFYYRLPYAAVGQKNPEDSIVVQYRFWECFQISKISLEAFTKDYFLKKRPRSFIDEGGFSNSFEIRIYIEQPGINRKKSLEETMENWRTKGEDFHHLLPLQKISEIEDLKIFWGKVGSIDSKHWKKGIEESVSVYSKAVKSMVADQNISETIALDFDHLKKLKYQYKPFGDAISFEERAVKVSELLQIRIYMERFRRSLWEILDELEKHNENIS